MSAAVTAPTVAHTGPVVARQMSASNPRSSPSPATSRRAPGEVITPSARPLSVAHCTSPTDAVETKIFIGSACDGACDGACAGGSWPRAGGSRDLPVQPARVFYMLEAQRVWGGGGRHPGVVGRDQQVLDGCPRTHPRRRRDHRPHDEAHHVVQESVGLDLEGQSARAVPPAGPGPEASWL